MKAKGYFIYWGYVLELNWPIEKYFFNFKKILTYIINDVNIKKSINKFKNKGNFWNITKESFQTILNYFNIFSRILYRQCCRVLKYYIYFYLWKGKMFFLTLKLIFFIIDNKYFFHTLFYFIWEKNYSFSKNKKE